MCVQDLKVSRRLSARRVDIPPSTGGNYTPIDLTRVAMVLVPQDADPIRLVSGQGGIVIDDIPADKELTNPTGTLITYTRESMGAAVNMPAWVYSEVVAGAVIIVHEYDADTMHAIYGPL